ncbi:MAG: M28 family metallopeptidase [Candidatus Poseidoniaceae archaeon]
MVSSRVAHALVLVLLMCSAPLSGCFAPSDGEELPSADDLEIRPSTWIGGEFQTVAFTADEDLSLYVPYLLRDPATNFVQNSTIVDLNEGETVELTLLAPPRTTTAVVQIGLPGRDAFPVRDVNESWATWVARGGMGAADRGPAASILAGENTTWPSIQAGNVTGGPSTAVVASIERLAAPAYDESEGARHSTGFVNGRDTYDTLAFLTNEDLDPTDLADGAEGFLNRWAGQGNAAYEDAAQFLIQEFESFGLEVNVQRYEYTDWQGNQNPEGYNICGFRYGTLFPNEWMVFGAHFDVAPPINALALDPHVTGQRTYGTRVGAYDNTAGTSMVLEVAEAMANAATRRTMVFCLWSGEEGGKRGSDYWTDFYVSQENPDVTVTNYVNLDMMGINWPGDWVLSCYIGPEVTPGEVIDQAEMYGLAEWIGAGELGLESQIERGWAAWLEDGESAMWTDSYVDTVAIYESPTARSDHDSFQEHLDTITMGWNGVVDGYPCYHRECDRLPTMEEYMVTDGRTGEQNLVESFDVVAWWSTMTFLALDEQPILNAL